MMKTIRLLAPWAHSTGLSGQAGDLVLVPLDLAQELIAAGAAEPVQATGGPTTEKTGPTAPLETATAPTAQNTAAKAAKPK